MLYPLPSHNNETIRAVFMFWKSFVEIIGQLVISANCHYFTFKLFNIFPEEVVRNGNIFGSRIYIRYCVKFKTFAFSSWTMDWRIVPKVLNIVWYLVITLEDLRTT